MYIPTILKQPHIKTYYTGGARSQTPLPKSPLPFKPRAGERSKTAPPKSPPTFKPCAGERSKTAPPHQAER